MISGTTATITGNLVNPHTGKPEWAPEGTVKLLIVEPGGNEKTIEEAAIKRGENEGQYYYEFVPAEVGLWHYRWMVENFAADEGTFSVTSEFAEGKEPDLLDLKVIVPRARRKMEGPWGNPNGKPEIPVDVLYAMVADACGDTMMLAGSWWHNELLVKTRDPLGGFPTEWKTATILTEWESAIIAAQAALNYYTFLFRDMKISETIRNEGTEFTYALSANVIRNYLEAMKTERDRAIAGLRINLPLMDRCASNIRIRDQATVAVLEWWDVNSPGITGGGLPGGQEATTIPWYPGPSGGGY